MWTVWRMTRNLNRLAFELSRHRRAPRWPVSGRIPAAICVPLVDSATDIETWIILRPPFLRNHAGEFCFPGGRAEASDADLSATAVREAAEELGVSSVGFRLLGSLTPIPVATSDFVIYPFVAAAAPTEQPRPSTSEVAELITAPLAAFLDGRFEYEAVDMKDYVSPVFRFERGCMYGASAHILLELLELYAQVTGKAIPAPRMLDVPPWVMTVPSNG